MVFLNIFLEFEMAKESGTTHSLGRLLFCEGLSLAGFLHLHFHPLANTLWEWLFYHSALFFLVAYPVLYVYRWKLPGGCLATLMWPLSFPLSIGLGAATYLWIAYFFLVTGNPYYGGMMNHPVALGLIFPFLYFPVLQPILGVTAKVYPLGELWKLALLSLLGGAVGYFAGWALLQKWGSHVSSGDLKFTLWLGLILLGAALGAFLVRRRASV